MKSKLVFLGTAVLCLLAVLSNNALGDLNEGLIARWSFDNAFDPGHDESSNGHNGTVYGATISNGKWGNALIFNGSSDYVDVADAPGLNPTDAVTITAWFKADSFALGTYSWPPILGKSDNDQLRNYDLAIQKVFESTPQIGGAVYTEGGWCGLPNPPTPAISEGIWYFAAVTYNGSTFTLYTGDEYGTPLIDQSLSGSGSLVPSSNNLNIGRNPANTDRYFDGAIDEVRIYNRALNSDEINQVYSTPEPATLLLLTLGGLLLRRK
jgi:hypothetical protein